MGKMVKGAMKSTISTCGVDQGARSRHWHETIAKAYFPLDLTFQRPEAFDGELTSWNLGDVSLSRLTSDALLYRRLPRHFREPGPEEFLVTLPVRSEVRFAQGGKEVRANPGAFFIERSHEPYEFSHAEPADLWVMKLSKDMLGGRIRAPDRFCSLQFDATNGANGLFVDMIQLIPQRFDAMTEETRAIVGRQLVDLLALAIQSDERVLTPVHPPCVLPILRGSRLLSAAISTTPILVPMKWPSAAGFPPDICTNCCATRIPLWASGYAICGCRPRWRI